VGLSRSGYWLRRFGHRPPSEWPFPGPGAGFQASAGVDSKADVGATAKLVKEHTMTTPLKPELTPQHTYDSARTALGMVLALERGDIDGWWTLWQAAEPKPCVLLALTAQSTSWGRIAAERAGDTFEEFLEHERWPLLAGEE
jgi:hypothetical protein